jgi:DNA-binding transcriptional ArsR family regulator
MADAAQPPPAAPNAGQWNPDLIFAVLADPVRRNLLRSLAHSGGKPASVLRGASARRLDATLKHLVAMRAAGLLVTAPDPVDGRRQLYSLAPTVPLVKTPEGGAVLDFGFVAVRW